MYEIPLGKVPVTVEGWMGRLPVGEAGLREFRTEILLGRNAGWRGVSSRDEVEEEEEEEEEEEYLLKRFLRLKSLLLM